MSVITVTTENGTAYQTVEGVRDDTASRGVDLVGALITAVYADGSSEELTWAALDPYTFGGASGADIGMVYGFDIHGLVTTKRLASLEINLAPASSVFDITTANETHGESGSTPSSKNGYSFFLGDYYQSLPGEIAVTYSDIVNLTGSAAVGDLFTTLKIDFSGLEDGGLLGNLSWNSDIDTLRTAGDLVPVEPPLNEIFGTAGNDRNDARLIGTDAADRIYDDAGRDEMVGGGGADVFVLALDGAKDEIRDFLIGEDLIDLTEIGATSFDDLTIRQDGRHARVVFQGEKLEIKDTIASDLSAADFLFADEGISAPEEPVEINEVLGTDGNDRNDARLFGTDGVDYIFDGDGRDEMVGSGGADIFFLANDGIRDEIFDFVAGEDRLDISAAGVTDFADVTIRQDGAHVRVLYGGDAVELKGIAAGLLTADDFIFA